MKKLICSLSILVIAIQALFATTWTKTGVFDAFGDSAGPFIMESVLHSGTYSTHSKNGKLAWKATISDAGEVTFYIYENGVPQGLSAYGITSQNKIHFKLDDGSIITLYGKVGYDDNYIHDTFYLSYDFRRIFIEQQQFVIAITTPYGTYTLGTLDTSEITDDLFYDKVRYEEGVAFFDNKEYQKAYDVFEGMRISDFASYEFYHAEVMQKQAYYWLTR